MRTRGLRRWRDATGQTTIEFALIAVVLIQIVLGIIEGGRIFGNWLIITNEAREAARFGVVGLGDPARQPTLASDVRGHIFSRTAGLLDQNELSAAAVLGPDPANAQWLQVQINYRVELLANPLMAWFPRFVPLTAISTMRTEDGAVSADSGGPVGG